MNPFRLPSRATLAATLALTSSLTLMGCTSALVPTASPNAISVTGNWQLSSTAPAASRLSSISGELTGSSASITGIFHSNSTSACIAPTTSFELTGSANAKNVVTLTGSNLAGGTLTVTGTLASDGKSISGAQYNVVGGSCAFAAPAVVTAQAYSSITGNYSGTFNDGASQSFPITASFTQTPDSDTDGNFTLNGSATVPNNPCFNSPVPVTNSQVTGGNFNFTYTDSTTGNSITSTGTFSPDGNTLTVNHWHLEGSCGPDDGAGSLSK